MPLLQASGLLFVMPAFEKMIFSIESSRKNHHLVLKVFAPFLCLLFPALVAQELEFCWTALFQLPIELSS